MSCTWKKKTGIWLCPCTEHTISTFPESYPGANLGNGSAHCTQGNLKTKESNIYWHLLKIALFQNYIMQLVKQIFNTAPALRESCPFYLLKQGWTAILDITNFRV